METAMSENLESDSYTVHDTLLHLPNRNHKLIIHRIPEHCVLGRGLRLLHQCFGRSQFTLHFGPTCALQHRAVAVKRWGRIIEYKVRS